MHIGQIGWNINTYILLYIVLYRKEIGWGPVLWSGMHIFYFHMNTSTCIHSCGLMTQVYCFNHKTQAIDLHYCLDSFVSCHSKDMSFISFNVLSNIAPNIASNLSKYIWSIQCYWLIFNIMCDGKIMRVT